MSVTLAFHGIAQAAQPRLTEVFNTHVRRVRARLEALTTPEFLQLEGQIEQVPNQQLLRVSLRLKLPGGLITSSREGEGLKALLIAFDELERKLDKHLARPKGFRSPARASRE